MIKNISQSGKYIIVAGGGVGNYINNPGLMGVGQLRYNTNNQQMEVYNGLNWQTLNMDSVHVGLTLHAESILDWAHQKMHEEKELEKLSAEYPTIKDLVNQINEKKDQIKMVQTLIKKETNVQHQPV